MTTIPCPRCGAPRAVIMDRYSLPVPGLRIAPCKCAKEKRDE
jgi:hypothetical protein